jgi:hypothetical protein
VSLESVVYGPVAEPGNPNCVRNCVRPPNVPRSLTGVRTQRLAQGAATAFQYSRHDSEWRSQSREGEQPRGLQVSYGILRLSVDAVVCAVPLKNKSEMLLEGYLRHQGCNDFDFEPNFGRVRSAAGRGACAHRRVDYRP